MIKAGNPATLARQNDWHIYLFYSGVINAYREMEVEEEARWQLALDFARFLGDRYPNAGGSACAVYLSTSSDLESYEKFLQLWLEFEARTPSEAWLESDKRPVFRTEMGMKMLGFIRKRPGMYGGKSLDSLYSFMNGFLMAVEARVPGSRMAPDFGEFQSWLMSQAEWTSHCGWRHYIMRYSDHNDERSFDMFFELLDEFMGKTKV